MFTKSLLLLASMLLIAFEGSAQIKKVWIETYYVSDNLDATDTTGGRSIPVGAKTYRIYVELEQGSRLKKMYGDVNHALKIQSTADFYNNIDRPTASFGYQINKTWFMDNPTLALDSWLTLGLATKTHLGVLKEEDLDGSLLVNNGGTALVPGGILVNTDPYAGIPLTTADGMIPFTSTMGQWVENGFKDLSGTDTTVFGSVNSGSSFISNSALLQQNLGVTGNSPDSNRVLIAQLTTAGEISYELNLEVDQTVNGVTTTVKYVANDDSIAQNEKVSPFLTYPPVCGCRDSKYLEYSEKYGCDNSDSCKTKIVYGCKDKAACNYDPDANFNVPLLCCYPGYCNDRDIAIVCPSVNDQNRMASFTVFPNPGQNKISIQIASQETEDTRLIIYNSTGRQLMEKKFGMVSGAANQEIDISGLNPGLYLFHLYRANTYYSLTFLKN